MKYISILILLSLVLVSCSQQEDGFKDKSPDVQSFVQESIDACKSKTNPEYPDLAMCYLEVSQECSTYDEDKCHYLFSQVSEFFCSLIDDNNMKDKCILEYAKRNHYSGSCRYISNNDMKELCKAQEQTSPRIQCLQGQEEIVKSLIVNANLSVEQTSRLKDYLLEKYIDQYCGKEKNGAFSILVDDKGYKRYLSYEYDGSQFVTWYLPTIREALDWIEEKTPKDSRFISLHDYGGMIRAIGRRDAVLFSPSMELQAMMGKFYDMKSGSFADHQMVEKITQLFSTTKEEEIADLMKDLEGNYLFVTPNDRGKVGMYRLSTNRQLENGEKALINRLISGEHISNLKRVYKSPYAHIYQLDNRRTAESDTPNIFKVNSIAWTEDDYIFSSTITGWNNKSINKQSDFSDFENLPSEYKLGEVNVLPEIEKALRNMSVGEERIIEISPKLGYPNDPTHPASDILRNKTLFFRIRVEEIAKVR